MELNVKQSGIERRILTSTYRKTRREKITKRVHELYLRNDIACGWPTCSKCSFDPEARTLADLNNETRSSLAPYKHVLIVDAQCVLKFIDVFHHEVFKNTIILQSVWNHVKRLNPAIYKKMNQLYLDGPSDYFVYMNEFSAETFVDTSASLPKESDLEENLIKAVQYFQLHWKNSGVRPVLLCSSDEVRNKIKPVFENSFTMIEYVKGITNATDLYERLCDLDSKEERGRALFPEYLSQDEMLDGLARGIYKKGSFKLSLENYLEANILFDDATQWFVQGRVNMNRAINGDTVVAALLPKEQWTCPEKVIRLRDAEEQQAKEMLEGSEDLHDEEGIKAAKRTKLEILPTAKIVGVLKRNWRSYCGLILPANIEKGKRFLFAPSERLIPRIRIETSHYEELRGKKIVVAIDSWPRDSFYPRGHYVRTIGVEGERETEDEVILLEHEIPHHKFPPAVFDCLPKMPWTPQASPERLDMRDLDICSVDPVGCTDIDDALHCKILEDGNLEVGVHIADVTHFVRPDTAMDQEAALRSTTVYLCGRRIDMLPDLLSSNLCSLRDDGPRYAFSVVWKLTPEAEILNTRFHKSLIHSRAALTYQRAQDLVDNKPLEEIFDDLVASDALDAKKEIFERLRISLKQLMALSKKLKVRRVGHGALQLASSEIRFDVDPTTGTPIKVIEKAHLPTMSMVEEFMLLANISVAEKILAEYPDCAILRRHPVPEQAAFKPLVELAKACGFEINPQDGKTLAESLDTAEDPKNPMVNTMLRMLTTRCMTQAVYFPAGTLPHTLYIHYGLAARVYTHFTSPIRRYADIMVHRLLATVINADKVHPAMLDRKRLVKQTDNMNYRHRQAQYASRASTLLNTHLMLKANPEKNPLDSFVIGIRKNGLQVMVPKYGLETVIIFPATLAKTDEEVLEIAKQYIRPFQKVKVKLELVEKNFRKKIEVTLVEPKIEGLNTESIEIGSIE
uniref:Protein DIS3 homolog n=1 Tax=Acrobeloides nanus TaxID=290746 RepID=A0A914CRX0_9BILA